MRVPGSTRPSVRPGKVLGAGPAPAAGAPGRAPAAPAGDVALIAGIPAAELTPQVRAGLDRLIAEVHDLRGQIDWARKRIAYLEDLADRDALAPVLNRRAFVRELGRMISFAQRYGVPGSVLYIDIDGMKRINDRYGHAAGDAALKRVAEVLLHSLRGSDVVGRLGGDEFGVILAQADQAAGAAKAKALARAIESDPGRWNGSPLPIAVSYGAYSFAGDEEVDQALHAADQAMYAHKRRPVAAGPA